MSYRRAITLGVELKSGIIYDADELFNVTKFGFKIRKQFHEGKILLHCCECYQELDISTSKYDRLHFKHQKKSNPCPLKDGNLSPLEMEISKEIFRGKESDRHIELKNKLAQKLMKIKGVDLETLTIDNKFIIADNERRKPDVYCEYYDRKLVFEIQLSKLSLRYILSRYNFYKKNGMYLIWILDNFDIHGQSQLERDIKYLTEFQNFFRLDEEEEEFKLICDYKFPFLTDKNKLLTKWLTKSVSINQLKFSNKYYQIFYFNFGQVLEEKTSEQKTNKIKIEKAQQERQRRAKEENAKLTAVRIVEEIRRRKKNDSFEYFDIEREIENLDLFEKEILNQELGLQGRLIDEEPILNLWFKNAKEKHFIFLHFIMRCKAIELSIQDINNEGVTLLMEIHKSDLISKRMFERELFKRGYRLIDSDLLYFRHLEIEKSEKDSLIMKFKYFDKLSNKNLISEIDGQILNVLYMIESAKRREFIATKMNNWVAFANNAIQHYAEFWEYLELAFRKFSLFTQIIKNDKKGTFQNKLKNFHENYPRQNYEIDEIVRELYPELYEE